MGKIKEIILSKIHKGNHIIQYKRSHMHPLLNKRYFNDTFGYFTITKMWNIKNIDLTSWFSYEKNRNICWEWKVEIINDKGKYVLPLSLLFTLGLYSENGRSISDRDAFIFYR